jgi:sulfur carrier protein
MKISVNGEDREVRHNLNIYELLIDLELSPEQSGIAVAVNREVIPKTVWKDTELREDSEIEIIRAIQGG